MHSQDKSKIMGINFFVIKLMGVSLSFELKWSYSKLAPMRKYWIKPHVTHTGHEGSYMYILYGI